MIFQVYLQNFPIFSGKYRLSFCFISCIEHSNTWTAYTSIKTQGTIIQNNLTTYSQKPWYLLTVLYVMLWEITCIFDGRRKSCY